MLCNAANYLVLKGFNSSIANVFVINIVIAEADLIKYFVGDSGIVKTDSVVEEIICIGHYRCFSLLVASYEVRVVAYCFYSIEILTKYTDLNTITTADKELYDFTAIGVYIAINLDIEAR